MFNVSKLQCALKDLVIVPMLGDIMTHMVDHDGVAIVNTSTSSGKTLLVAPTLASRVDLPVIVLQPRRFLATNAAETLCELGGFKLGDEVSYAVGVRGRETFLPYSHSNVVYMTYGYALHSNVISTAPVVFIDEAHEHSLDMAICKAILKRRLTQGEKVMIGVMSATMDGDAEFDYWPWDSAPKNFTVTKHRYNCERLHRPAETITQAVMGLVERERKGILVFLPGKGEIEETAEKLREATEGTDIVLDIATVHGESDYEERKAAAAAPKPIHTAKVLLGTNVIESGVNLPWADSGVTSGTGRELSYTEGGAQQLIVDELPGWRLEQQEGRVNRFGDGIFILTGQTRWNDRPVHTVPEIRRIPLTTLVMHCAALNLSPFDLEFQHNPSPRDLYTAHKALRTLNFVTDDYSLTEDGQKATKLPLSLEAAAFLIHAEKIGFLEEGLIGAAALSAGPLRKDRQKIHYLTDVSDILEAALAFACGIRIQWTTERSEQKAGFEGYNIGWRRFNDVKDTAAALERILHISPKYDTYHRYADGTLGDDEKVEFENAFRQCMLAGHANRVTATLNWTPRGETINYNSVSKASCTERRANIDIAASAIARMVSPRNGGMAFSVAENITYYTADDLRTFAKTRPDLVVVTSSHLGETITFNGRAFVTTSTSTEDVSLGDILAEAVARFEQRATLHLSHSAEPARRSPTADDSGTRLSDILSTVAEIQADKPAEPKVDPVEDNRLMQDRLRELKAHYAK